MKLRHITAVIFVFLFNIISAQEKYSIPELLERYNNKTVPYITVDSLNDHLTDFTILDTRKRKEFEVSHLPNAIWVGEKFDMENLAQVDQGKPIVVYCSVGVRSENYGEDLIEAGFNSVFNLYGSIFSWKDAGFVVEDMGGNATDQIHVYSRKWGKYLKTGKKVF